MDENSKTASRIDRIGPWVIILGVVGVLIGLAWSSRPSVFSILCVPEFLAGFLVYLVQVAFVSVFGGGVGILFGFLIRRHEWLTNSAARFLRLAMWLPFFVFWALPIWRTRPSNHAIVDALTNIVIGASATVPVVLLGSCYYYLSSRASLELQNLSLRAYVAKSVVPLALLLCLFWQLLLEVPWPWAWMNSELRISASWSAAILIAVAVVLVNVLSRWSIQSDAEVRPKMLWTELQNSNSRSLIGVVIIGASSLVAWQILAPLLKSSFLIEPPFKVGYSILDLLIFGNSSGIAVKETIWLDVNVSLFEIIGAIALAGLFAFPLSELIVRYKGSLKFDWIVFAAYVSPATLAVPMIDFVGIGMLSKVLMICSVVLFPFARAMWTYIAFPLASRVLLAIDEALPYGFVGMVFAEAYAATAGLGFRILVSAASLAIADSIATALITFGLLVLVSSTLRFLVKRISNAKTWETVVPVSTSG